MARNTATTLMEKILIISLEPTMQFHFMYKIRGIAYGNFTKYKDKLVKAGFMRVDGKFYSTTEKGREFLKMLHDYNGEDNA